MRRRVAVALLLLVFNVCAQAQQTPAAVAQPTAQAPEPMPKAPPRAEGEGPFPRLILRGATLIDGTGAPPNGPVDILIEKNRIAEIRAANPGFRPDPQSRFAARPGDRELDVRGMYVLPGFIDMHTHIGPDAKPQVPAEYIFKLWLGHGITTVREVLCGNGIDWVLDQRARSERNEITAPRIRAYCRFSMGAKSPISTATEARAWVDDAAQKGVDGIKFFGTRPEVMEAALDEARKRNLRTAAHIDQTGVARVNALQAARWGLVSLEHWYGLPESLFADRTVQNFPADYNYANEADRFGLAGRLWAQAAPPHSPKWNSVMDEMLKLDFTLDPTFTIYDANRDLMRARRAEWHEQYTMPAVWRNFAPGRTVHGSYWYYWTTDDEAAWKHNYQLWMQFVNEYKNRGGRVTTGEDAGFIYSLYGFGYIRELELLREAGFHPLEVVRSATLYGAQALGAAADLGTVEAGKLADLVVVTENPLANFASLYGTGAIKLTEKNEVVRVGGVRYTIKDGILYDAPKLLADVRRMVAEQKKKENFEITQPGVPVRH
jgi:imidazolonepropionase-like amidohydrolase